MSDTCRERTAEGGAVASRRFIVSTHVAIRAETEDEAAAMANAFFATEEWTEVADGIEVYDPAWPPEEVVEDDDGPECTCPPDLIARGGFRGSCAAHGARR